MNIFSFSWRGQNALEFELARGIRSASIRTAIHGRPISLTLWHSDGTGVLIQSTMYDVDERQEVGVLSFASATELSPDESIVDLPASFNGPINVSKLLLVESSFTAESGVLLKTEDGQQIVILAGVYPYSLAIDGLLFKRHIFEPEYPLMKYRYVDIL